MQRTWFSCKPNEIYHAFKMYLELKIVLFAFAGILTCSVQPVKSARSSRSGCIKMLRDLRKNPPKHTVIYINIRQSKAKYVCHKGFILSGSELRTCRGGKWSAKKEPKCSVPRPCGRPGDIPHLKYVGSSFDFKDTLRYKCDNGFILKGPKRRKCGITGKWSKAPKCEGPCGRPDDIPYAQIEGSSYDFEDTLSYSCMRGYKLNGPNSRKCLENGVWSTAPSCSRIQCENPGKLTMRNGNVTSSDADYFYGATLLFECNEGYELKGDETVSCLKNGWTPRRWPYCIKKVCADPGSPEGGRRFGYRTVGSTMQFSCQSGYKLHGSAIRTCLENKEWSGSLATCQNGNTHCPILGTPVSGRKYGTSYDKGDLVKFECKRGFVLKGSAVRICNENGTWNGTETFCKDEFEDSFEDANTTAFNLRKNLIDTLLAYTSVVTKNSSGDTRGRAIFNQYDNSLDLVFVLDASTSVSIEKFKLGLRFVKKLVKFLGTNSTRAFKDKIRTAAVTFGTDVTLHFNLGDDKVSTIKKTLSAIDEIDYEGGATASAAALKKVKDVVVPQSRFGSDRVLIFITDGKSNVGGPPQKVAKILREEDRYEIFVIGLGKNVRRSELWQIASNGRHNVVRLRSYGDLDKAIDKAVNTHVDYSLCGGSTFDPRGRIVGGRNSKRGRWPWQVAIYTVSNRNYVGQVEFHCGGALISRQWVLTAAHCFFVKNEDGKVKAVTSPSSYFVYAGVHELSEKGPKGTTQGISTKKIIPHDHDDFDYSSYQNDIALVKVTQPFHLTAFVRTVCLPEKDEQDLVTPDEYGTVAGWGGTKQVEFGKRAQNGDFSKVLKHASFKIQSDQLCVNKASLNINSSTTFCAGDGEGKNDACHGDSGGAFVLKSGKRRAWVAAGIVSWGDGCALKGHYGYYTKVHPFIDWIRQKMKEYKD